jgi:hypothetical protein
MNTFKNAFSVLSVISISLALPVTSAHGADYDSIAGSAGVGAMYGQTQGYEEGGFVLMLKGYGKQLSLREPFKAPSYGHAHLRLEIGTGFSFAGATRLGTTLVGASEDRPVNLHLGVEPLNFDFSASTDPHREAYFEWLPMANAGIQFRIDDFCSALALARGGAAIGTLSEGGGRGAYGVGAEFTCPGVKAAGEVTRIAADNPADIVSLNLDVNVSERVAVGVLGQAITTRDEGSDAAFVLPPQEGDKSEARGFVTISGAF